MQHENSAGECAVQTRLEAVANISKRQNEDLYNLSYCLNQTLARLRGELPQAQKCEQLKEPIGLIGEIELSLQVRDEAITLLNEIERELRSLL